MGKVLVVGRAEFPKAVGEHDPETTSYISIESTEDCAEFYEYEDNQHFLPDSAHTLNLEFDDLESDLTYGGYKFRAITEEQAREIVEFIGREVGRDFVIHCRAGKSRSQAIGRFLVDFYDYQEERPILSTYNQRVFSELKKAWYGRIF